MANECIHVKIQREVVKAETLLDESLDLEQQVLWWFMVSFSIPLLVQT